MSTLTRFLPFLRWFPLTGDNFMADFMAGITVALHERAGASEEIEFQIRWENPQ